MTFRSLTDIPAAMKAGRELSPKLPFLQPNFVNPARMLVCIRVPVIGCYDINPDSESSTTPLVKKLVDADSYDVYAFGGKYLGVRLLNMRT